MATRTLFDHITNITSVQNPKYWDSLEDADKKTWSNYMVHRFLSMNPDWIEVLSEIQPYTQVLEPKQLYLALIGILPKGRRYLKYTKNILFILIKLIKLYQLSLLCFHIHLQLPFLS